MSSIREQIATAALTALNTGRPGNVPAFVRARREQPVAADLPCNTLLLVEEETERTGSGRTSPLKRHRLQLHILTWASGGPAGSPTTTDDAATDPSYVWAVKTLENNTLGGLVVDCIETKAKWSLGMVSDAYACDATTGFLVEYASVVGNPEAKA